MAKFVVTVVRTGSIIVDDPNIISAALAMAEVDKNAKLDNVVWDDDWGATDAQISE